MNGSSVLFFNRPEEWADPLQADSYSYRLNQSMSPASYVDELQANTAPILTLVGREDGAFYPDKFEDVFSKNAPHAQLEIVPGAKHLDLPSNQTAANLIVAWLEKTYTQ